MEIALETPAGETSLLEEAAAGGYFVIHVEQIVDPRVKPVEEVRDELVRGWQDERRRELAKARAEELRDRLAGGATPAEALADSGLETKPIQPLRRDEAGTAQGINPAVVRALFATAPGAVAEEVVEVGGAYAVVGTDEVIAADPGGDGEALSQLERELEAEMRSDLIAQFEAQLRRDYPVEIDGAAINRLIQAGGAAPAAPSRPLPSALF
jgi:peptidyl-prolyl cis-trans isomerase D